MTGDIFKTLIANKIRFAVFSAKYSFGDQIMSSERDNFILIRNTDYPMVTNMGFHLFQEDKRYFYRDLLPDEVELFKKQRKFFKKTFSNNHGDVYELHKLNFRPIIVKSNEHQD